MRLREILTESVTFGVARLSDWGEGKMGYSDPFQKKHRVECWVCDGKGYEKYGGYTGDDGIPRPETKEECRMCKGEGKIDEWKSDAGELNVSNSNAFEIQRMLGLTEPDYAGAIKKEDFPSFRRRLIAIKNGQYTEPVSVGQIQSAGGGRTRTSGPTTKGGIDQYTQPSSVNIGKMRASTDSEGQSRIGRGATIIHGSRSYEQVERYIDKLLALMDFAQKNDCDLTWA